MSSRHSPPPNASTPSWRSSTYNRPNVTLVNLRQEPITSITANGITTTKLVAGMTIAIEPMITAGSPEVFVHDDEWSISTVDGSLIDAYQAAIAAYLVSPAAQRFGNAQFTTTLVTFTW